MRFISLTLLFLFISNLQSIVYAQVGIGTTTPLLGTSLQVDGANTGVLIYRVFLSGTDDVTTIPSIGAMQEGLMVYNTNSSTNINVETDVVPGFYLWDGSAWKPVAEAKRKRSGWVALTDSDYTNTLNFVNSPLLTDFSNFENIDLNFSNNAGDGVIDLSAPDGYSGADFYNDTTNRITPIASGDSALIRLQFDATPLQNNGFIVLQLDIGANDIPGDVDDIVIFQKSIPLIRGGNRITNVSETILIFELGTFLANGGKLRMAYSRSNNNTGTSCTVSGFSMVLQRLD